MAVIPSRARAAAAKPAAEGLMASEGQIHAFRQLMQGVAVMAGLIHAVFLGIFIWSKINALAAINVGSVLCYVLVFLMARRGRAAESLLVGFIEVMIHSVAATMLIGWDSAFHYYILLGFSLIALSSVRRIWLKVLWVMVTGAGYIGLDLAFRDRIPPFTLPPAIVEGLHYFNILTTIVVLTFIAAVYYYLISITQAALREMAAKLLQMSTTDGLTRLHNRRHFDEILATEYRRAFRDDRPLSLLMVDIDHFKTINDTHGHAAGDLCLKEVARTMGECVRRPPDTVCRYGGEEFAVLLPETSPEGAMIVADKLMERIRVLEVTTDAGAVLRLTVSIGVACHWPRQRSHMQNLLAEADAALYAAKRDGRNQARAATELPDDVNSSNPQDR